MTIVAYQQAAQRTLAHLEGDNDTLHMVLGIATETGELCDIFKRNLAYGKEIDKVNLAEEIGDQAWYWSNLATLNNIALQDMVVGEGSEQKLFETASIDDGYVFRLVLKNIESSYQASSLHLHITKNELQGLFSQDLFADLIQKEVKNLFMIATASGLDFQECLYKNIAKLKVRFPDKFTEEAALNRDLDQERMVLEGGNDV